MCRALRDTTGRFRRNYLLPSNSATFYGSRAAISSHGLMRGEPPSSTPPNPASARARSRASRPPAASASAKALAADTDTARSLEALHVDQERLSILCARVEQILLPAACSPSSSASGEPRRPERLPDAPHFCRRRSLTAPTALLCLQPCVCVRAWLDAGALAPGHRVGEQRRDGRAQGVPSGGLREEDRPERSSPLARLQLCAASPGAPPSQRQRLRDGPSAESIH